MAFCANCGTQVQDEVKFCPSCGTDVATGQAPEAAAAKAVSAVSKSGKY